MSPRRLFGAWLPRLAVDAVVGCCYIILEVSGSLCITGSDPNVGGVDGVRVMIGGLGLPSPKRVLPKRVLLVVMLS